MLPWCNWRDTVALKATVREELRDHTPPVAPYRECGVMVTRLLWEQESQFKSDIFDQWIFSTCFSWLPSYYSWLSKKKRSSRTQQAKLHNEGSPSGKWHLALTQTACFIADRRFDPDTLNLWTRDGIADMKDLGSFAVDSGVPVQIGSCPPLSTYGCVPFVDLLYYYSQLASDGAVVLCKLGSHAAVVQWLVYQPSKLRMRFRLPFAAPISYG